MRILRVFSVGVILSLLSTTTFAGLGGWLVGGYQGHKKEERTKAAKADGWHIDVENNGNERFTASSWRYSEDGKGIFKFECDESNNISVMMSFASIPIDEGVAKFMYSNDQTVEIAVSKKGDAEYVIRSEKDSAVIFKRSLHQENVVIELYDPSGNKVTEGKRYNLNLYADALYDQCSRAGDIKYRTLVLREPPPNVFDDEE